jgi:chemotaxis family two-component system sensor kinase Cph1
MNSPLDLTNCDREKIHQITYIQGHGAFVAVSPIDMKIQHASENLPSFFGREDAVQYYYGKRLNELMAMELAHKIQDKMRNGSVAANRQGRFVFTGETPIDVFVYMIRENLFGIEFEKLPELFDPTIPTEEILNNCLSRMRDCQTLESISLEACRAVRHLTGLDRVMIYKFFPPAMYGEVIAEDKMAEAHTFMNHRFPATDIPKPARDLYLKNHVRFIYDSEGENSEIHPKVNTDKFTPLDMSDSRIRGVSKIHLEYLKNMGVRSSLSVAIICEQKLWGIISCHGNEPCHVSHTTRTMCEIIANNLSIGISMFELNKEKDKELNFLNRLQELFNKLKKSHDPLDQMFREGNSVLDLFNCNGMVLASEKKIDLFGLTPLPVDIKKVWAWTINKMENECKNFLVSESISELRPEFASLKDQVSGIIAIRLSDASDTVLILMRSEYLETIKWGGDPRKNLDARNYGGTINPRASFDTWTEVLKNNSVPWNKHEIKGIQNFKNLIFDSLVLKEQLLGELYAKLNSK